jgi:hypothetical protein
MINAAASRSRSTYGSPLTSTATGLMVPPVNRQGGAPGLVSVTGSPPSRPTHLRDRFTVELAGGGSLEAQGSILDHEYQITRDGIPLANVSKRWFRVRESYGVAVAPGQDDDPVLAITGLYRPPHRLNGA